MRNGRSFEPFVIATGRRGGRPPRDYRRTLGGIFWIAHTRTPWRIRWPNSGIGTWCFPQFRCWTASGLLDVILQALAGGSGKAEPLQMIDSIIGPGATLRCGGRGDSTPSRRPFVRRAYEQTPSRGQRTQPAYRAPPHLGQEADCAQGEPCMDARQSAPAILIAAKSFDSDHSAKTCGIAALCREIPTKRSPRIQHSVSQPLHALGNRIERFIRVRIRGRFAGGSRPSLRQNQDHPEAEASTASPHSTSSDSGSSLHTQPRAVAWMEGGGQRRPGRLSVTHAPAPGGR